jgi:hypothetical protein
MERVLLSVGQMSPRLVLCNDCSAYKRAQGFFHPCCHHADEAQCDLARACAARTIGVKDNIRSDYLHAVLRVDAHLLIGRRTLKLPVLAVM